MIMGQMICTVGAGLLTGMGIHFDRYWDRYGHEHADALYSRANSSEVLSPPQIRSLRTDYMNYSEIDAPIGNGILSLRIDIHSKL